MGAYRHITVSWILPVLFSLGIYYGFASNYTDGVFTEDEFRSYYGRGIYKYRTLGQAIQLKTHDFIHQFDLPAFAPGILEKATNISPQFYTAYFINNTIFLCLFCTFFHLLLNRTLSSTGKYLPDITVFSMMLFINLTQYVIAPYDMLSYFLFMLAVYLITQSDSSAGFASLCCTVILATLTRESSILIPVFYLAWHSNDPAMMRIKANPRRFIRLIVLCLCFIVPYFLLRVWLGFHNAYFENMRFVENFGFFESAGIILFLVISGYLLMDPCRRNACLCFFLGAIPYTLFVLNVANTKEVRLWVPVILGLVILRICPAPGSGPAVIPSRMDS